VPLKEPGWWYGADDHGVARLLRPLGAMYGMFVEHRLTRTRPFQADVPVICVGNFTAGGTGKTPFARVLVERLRALGEVPVTLSRGYGGRLAGPHWVDAARDTAIDVGDEPLLLAADGPVMIARDRAAGAREIARETTLGANTPTASVIVMDDGLQNPTLAQDLRFAVVDGARGFGNGCVIPAGPLRARLDAQLARVDAIVVNHGTASPDVSPVAARLRRDFTGPVLDATLAVRESAAWTGRRVVAFAGIGAPQRFFATLASVGADVRACVAFADHHRFTEADALRLLDLVASHGAELVTTEKDHARLAGAVGARDDVRQAARVLRVDMALSARDVGRLDALLVGVLAPRGVRSASVRGDA
jgi:tetraacyldisaccharide 4'-kinase